MRIARKCPGNGFLLLIGIAALISGCGGESPASQNGSASVGVSLASGTVDAAGASLGSSVISAVSMAKAPAPSQPAFDNVLVTVTKIALLPASDSGVPDPDGELESPDSPSESGASGPSGSIVALLPTPVTIDLLHPPSGSGIATLLNRFSDVPPGEYGKIRIYYDNVTGISGAAATRFHPTANYHFDVRLAGGKLVVPSDSDPTAGIPYYSLSIRLVGLKIRQAGEGGKFLLRPQVVAEVEAPKYLFSGTAQQVDHALRTFGILASGGQVVPAAYDAATTWRVVDGQVVDTNPLSGIEALLDSRLVTVIGSFREGVLIAEEIEVTRPVADDGGGGKGDEGYLY